MKAVWYASNPALHIAEARGVELASATSSAQFLMVLPHLRLLFSSSRLALCSVLEKKEEVSSYCSHS